MSTAADFEKRIKDDNLVSVEWRYDLVPDTAAMLIGPRVNRDRKIYGVNWAAIGMKSPDETVEFAKALLDAADLARILNEQEATKP